MEEIGRPIIKSFKDLEIYTESFQLQIEIEELLKTFPELERYLLVDQMRRCCRSIPAIISEGWALRDSVKEFKNFLRRAYGSNCEMINHLMLAKYKSYIKMDGYADELIKRYEILGMKITKLRNNWQKFK
ncbi:MAG: four helix bundle protein [Candidatus Woesebacteria bacterium]|nr:MAG: four helix bundle protein [Candidatus Woesebacteria bacterium]